MRRFFRAHRDEDFSQIQYLTAKCNRLVHENAALERECVVSRERQRTLQAELESCSLQLCQKEHTCQDLHLKHEQLLDALAHQRGLVQFLQQRLVFLTEESSTEVSLLTFQLEQVSSDLQKLQTSETQLQGLVEELHQEAHRTDKKAGGLQTELRVEAQLKAEQVEDLESQLTSKSRELQELQKAHASLMGELREQDSAHQRTVERLQQENAGSLHKLKEMAEQFEWLCEQQRHWMCCVKRFKDCLSDEKEALLLQVNRLQVELAGLQKNSSSKTVKEDSTPQHCDSWEVDAMVDLQMEADRWRQHYEELFNNHTSQPGQSCEDTDLKPP
ncbi:hyaluronan-mediated motility receptor isoform X1 [Electrophorus electricus]|uniref:hyaluronan-mediated motility receptor isoform X1 n=1 Tax=Electrophorus electricus TaxID=8005 RepID=UPI0015D0B3AA|nr:hyaluronan-mediated motility receptor isoform X1 [Electrophorus electricus]